MFGNLRDKFIALVTSRLFMLAVVIFALFSLLTHRLFVLQIVNGESYLNNFTLRIKREKTIKSTRGSIYDRNGVVLAADKLAYSVTIQDNYDSTSTKNMELNDTIYSLIKIVEGNGDRLNSDFDIIVNDTGEYRFTLSGRAQLRFLADIYGRSNIEDLLIREQTSTADDVIAYLCSQDRFGIGEYKLKDDGTFDFQPEEGYTKQEILKIITVRYAMSLNSYQKYISTTVAYNVGDETVAKVMENKDELQGVDIEEDTIREYIDDPSMSHILGYTGKISLEELSEYNSTRAEASEAYNYELNDMVGKSGIEQVEERKLQGKKGMQTIFVDNLGRVTETGDRVDPTAGSNLYLTIDSKLQNVVYHILEQKIAGIVVSKIQDIKDYDPEEESSASNIIIPMDDVYFALFDNNFLNIPHISSQYAGTYERQVKETYMSALNRAVSMLDDELIENKTVYSELDEELKEYEYYVVSMLQNSTPQIFLTDEVDITNAQYQKWRNGDLSLSEYLHLAIINNWIDITRIGSDESYMDSEEIYAVLVDYIEDELKGDTGFAKILYKYMIKSDAVTGFQICHIIYEQERLIDKGNELAMLDSGQISAYDFMLNRLKALDITPADLALDPCSGSCVVTDVHTGEVLACVSYPSYDNNRLANTIDSAYYNSLTEDKSLPLYDYATQQKTAPGSTFKPLTTTAALEEGVVTSGEHIECEGIFEQVEPPPRCWIYPGNHGNLDIVGAIQNSCNFFFYEMGYRLSMINGIYNSDAGVKRLAKYADLYGLSDKSGIEITESEPQVSDQDSVRSAIGQANHAYTTVQLARYVNAVANTGVCYNLSLLDKLVDSDERVLENYTPGVRNNMNVSSATWNAIHNGMREAVAHYDAFEDFPLVTAGKTGTAQQVTTRPNHALFIGFAPFNEPEIAVATRIAYGYTSANAAEVTRDVYKYYFGLEKEDSIVTNRAVLPDSQAIGD